ncbi:proline-rich protein 2-like [Melospiza melodia melodia]|uniref:proline-rich protein 2-like n=1 Tax=Melospiza melodia melodia TaxID=1914991 RepID=UPI002FD61E44
MNSSAFFFTKHLVGLRAAPSHKLNYLLYLQGSENQRGSSSGARPSRDFSLTASARSYTRGTAGVPAQPLPAAGPFGHLPWAAFRLWQEPRQRQPRHGAVAPQPAPAPGGLGSIPVRAFAPSRRCGGCTSLLPAASSPFLPPSCLAPSGESAEGSPPPRHPAGPPLPSGPERVRRQVPAPPGPVPADSAGSAACDTAGLAGTPGLSLQGRARRSGGRGCLPAGRAVRPGSDRPCLPRLLRAAMPPPLTCRRRRPRGLARPALPGLEARPRKG